MPEDANFQNPMFRYLKSTAQLFENFIGFQKLKKKLSISKISKKNVEFWEWEEICVVIIRITIKYAVRTGERWNFFITKSLFLTAGIPVPIHILWYRYFFLVVGETNPKNITRNDYSIFRRHIFVTMLFKMPIVIFLVFSSPIDIGKCENFCNFPIKIR